MKYLGLLGFLPMLFFIAWCIGASEEFEDNTEFQKIMAGLIVILVWLFVATMTIVGIFTLNSLFIN